MKGKVFLVGAGPGDPELLTLKALRLLREADVVLHDDLVSPQILKLVSPSAQLHSVGKRCGEKKITQEEINFLMTALAASGRQVLRLKAGDPLIFSRLAEEIQALRQANVEFEIVPGVSACFGAAQALAIPLTDREVSPALVLLAGHSAEGKDRNHWAPFVSSGATLVIYMPGRNYADLSSRLLRAGAKSETPCAIVSRATGPNQQIQVTNLGQLPGAPYLPSPTLLIVGEVVRFAQPTAFVADERPTQAELNLPIPAGLLFSALEDMSSDQEPLA